MEQINPIFPNIPSPDPKNPETAKIVTQVPNDPPAPLNADAQGSHRTTVKTVGVTQIRINGTAKTVSQHPTGAEVYGLAGEVLGHPASQVRDAGLPSPNPENARLKAAMGHHHAGDGYLVVNSAHHVALTEDQEFTAV